ncbi:MAG: hypothetical protein EXR99_00695 [Gemmataceae bacterium]|nr:hypothetical protein [Gemmataceae bacterium]
MDFEEFSGLIHMTTRLGLLPKESGHEFLDSLEKQTEAIDPTILVVEGFLTDWQLQKIIRHEIEALTFANLDLLEPIASGSLGRTYKARVKGTGSLVALKVLKKRFQDKKSFHSQFNRQAQIGLQLDHPKIVKILDHFSGDHNSPPWVLSEWIQGGCLREWLEHRSSVTCMEALKILEQITQALAYANKNGFSHGNIKPERILLDSTNNIRVSNFRQGSDFKATAIDTQSWTRSDDYEGLEMITKAKPGDPASDIFFTGCVFYQLLTGHSPLPESSDTRGNMYRSGSFRFTFNAEIEKTIPDPVLPLVKNMLSLEAKSRYQNFIQVQAVIQVVRNNLGVSFPEITAGKDKPTVFIVAINERKKILLKSYFQNRGYRVLVSDEFRNAVDSYAKKEFDHLLVELESASVIRPEYMRLINDSEMRRHKLNVVLLPIKVGKVDLPSRSGTVILPPPQDFSTIYQSIASTSKR